MLLGDMLTERSVFLILRKTVLVLHLNLPIKHRLHLHRLLLASIQTLNLNFWSELLIEAISAGKLLDETIFFSLSLTDSELICHVVDDGVLLGSSIVGLMSHSVSKIFADDIIAEGTLGIIFSSLLDFLQLTVLLCYRLQVQSTICLSFGLSLIGYSDLGLN